MVTMMKQNLTTIAAKTLSLFQRLLRQYVAPALRMTVSEWADKYRFLPTDYAAEPGRWNTSRAPYQKAIMDAFTQRGVRRVVAMLAAQLGKSEILTNVLGRFVHLDPCPALMVQPNIEAAEAFSKERLAPTVRDTPVLKRLIADPKTRDSGNTLLKKLFPGGFLALVGSNSPAGLASRSIRLLLVDELDRFEASAGTEGDPFSLAEKRTSNFWNAIIGVFSTPTDDLSRIAAEYSLGSQEEWRHQCPGCEEWQWVTLWNMRYEYETFEVDGQKSHKVTVVFWRCPDCGHEYTEAEVRRFPQEWLAQNPKITHIRSFRANSFASPWVPWGKIVAEYLDAGEDPEKVKTFVNTRLAEIYRPKGEIKDERVLIQRREKYDADLPDGVLLLTAAVDTQDNRLEYEVCGWGEGEECWGIRKGVVLGVPDQQETWDALDEQLDRLFYRADGKGLKVARTFIDSGGHYTQEVYKYCARNGRKQRIAIKGHRLHGIPIIYQMGQAKGYAIPLVMLGVNEGKEYVMQRLINVNKPGPMYFHFPDDDRRGYDQLYFRGLIAEKKEPKTVKGRKVMAWKNVSPDGRNEPLDLRVYNLACLYSINPNWAAYKAAVLGIKAVESAPKNKPENTKKRYGCVKKGVEGG
ncbi:phage terminase large subunit family protein [Anaeroselena agilis]|uniref:Phage terminase large subunit family protein n=1 Tax=Anaeroselena agilis TaxID=3063788 RepID=A0ABU3NYG8_9FIRM|nr:phage terminase large subunit family protein [Selenomonadales bacterium 4137-cl]